MQYTTKKIEIQATEKGIKSNLYNASKEAGKPVGF